MKVSCIQKEVHLGDVSGNLKAFLPEITALSKEEHDIVMLPEMWATGFDYHNLQSHSKNTTDIIEQISNSVSNKTLVISSLPENDNGKIYNTMFAINNEGVKAFYRKNFLFSPLKEDQYFDKGHDLSVFYHNNSRISLHTCYEIRFPELFRMAAFEGAELMLVPAIWPAEKREHWATMLKARAIENQCFVLGCNTSKAYTTKKTINCGSSMLVDPWGNILSEAPEAADKIISEKIGMEECRDIRSKIPSFNDAKNAFVIKRKSKTGTQ